MSSGSTISGSTSGPTSSKKPPANESEADYLARQANQASAAISRTFKQVQKDVVKCADPRLWLNEHSWATLAAATVTGFAAASTVVPSKEQQALKRLAKLERALHPEYDSLRHDASAKDRGIVSKILSHAMGALEPALSNIIGQVVAEKTTQPDADDIADAEARQAG
jgi:hypothetical protein